MGKKLKRMVKWIIIMITIEKIKCEMINKKQNKLKKIIVFIYLIVFYISPLFIFIK